MLHKQIQAVIQSVDASNADDIRMVFHVEWKFAASVSMTREELSELTEDGLRDMLAEQVEEMINHSNSAEAIEVGELLSLSNEATGQEIELRDTTNACVRPSCCGSGCAKGSSSCTEACCKASCVNCAGTCQEEGARLSVSLDGGETYQPAKEGVRILYANVPVDGEDARGDLHINATHEGLITDVWVTDIMSSEENPLDHNIGSKCELIEDIVYRLVAEND